MVKTAYDSLGRVLTVTNPYVTTSDPTYGITTFAYDSLGRPTVQTQQDGSSILQWCYNNLKTNGQTNCQSNHSSVTGTWTDSSDESGNHWQRVSDGLGRLVSVMEPDPSTNATSLETDYTYDPLNNLTRVVDTHGNVGGYRVGGGGLSAGAGFSDGVQLGLSNGNNICAYGGPFANAGVTGGDGVGGTIDGFSGYGDGPGGMVSGASVTAGIAGGADASATVTGTQIVPFGKVKCD